MKEKGEEAKKNKKEEEEKIDLRTLKTKVPYLPIGSNGPRFRKCTDQLQDFDTYLFSSASIAISCPLPKHPDRKSDIRTDLPFKYIVAIDPGYHNIWTCVRWNRDMLDWKCHLALTKVGSYSQLCLSRNNKGRASRLNGLHHSNGKIKK